MTQAIGGAADVLRHALVQSEDPIEVTLTLPRTIAEKLLKVLEAEHASGTVVIPIRELYTTTQSAAMLGISRATLMKLIGSGDIESVKVGTHHRVAADELLAYQRARQASHERATELLSEFSSRAGDFQSNVTFHSEQRPPRRTRRDRPST